MEWKMRQSGTSNTEVKPGDFIAVNEEVYLLCKNESEKYYFFVMGNGIAFGCFESIEIALTFIGGGVPYYRVLPILNYGEDMYFDYEALQEDSVLQDIDVNEIIEFGGEGEEEENK